MPGGRGVASDPVELLLRVVKAAGVEVRGRDLIGPVGAQQRRQVGGFGGGVGGDMFSFGTIGKDQILRAHPALDARALSAECLDALAQRRCRILKRILLTVEISFVLVRLLPIAEGTKLRRRAQTRYFAA